MKLRLAKSNGSVDQGVSVSSDLCSRRLAPLVASKTLGKFGVSIFRVNEVYGQLQS